MIILGYFLNAVGTVLGTVITILMWLFIAHAVLSWVSPDPRNPIVNFIYSATNPMLSRVRSKIKPIGMFDLSVIIVLLVLVSECFISTINLVTFLTPTQRFNLLNIFIP